MVKPSKPVVLTEGKVKLQKLSVMANYATNLFFASTENESDLDKIEAFLDDKFGVCYQDRNDDCIEAEFESRWDYPEEIIRDHSPKVRHDEIAIADARLSFHDAH